jgi:hypothetical protein
MPIAGKGRGSDDRILVSRGDCRPNATLYVFGVRQPSPPVSLPLKPHERGPSVDLGRILHDLYDRANYDLRLGYTGDPEPPLPLADAAWADRLLREKGLR